VRPFEGPIESGAIKSFATWPVGTSARRLRWGATTRKKGGPESGEGNPAGQVPELENLMLKIPGDHCLENEGEACEGDAWWQQGTNLEADSS